MTRSHAGHRASPQAAPHRHARRTPLPVLALLLLALLRLQAQESVGSPAELTAAERAWVAAHPEVVIALDDGNPPLNARLPSGEYAGISVDYVRLIAAKAGLTVRLTGSTWSEALRRAQAHEVDGIMSAKDTPERRRTLEFSVPYCETPLAVLTRRDFHPVTSLAGLAGSRVAVVRGTVRSGVVRRACPEATLVEVDVIQQAVRLLVEGNADAFIDDLPVIQELVDRNLITDLRIALLYFMPEVGEQRLGLRNDWPELVGIVDKAIAAITVHEHRAIRARWLHLGEGAALQRDPGLSADERAWLGAHPVLRVGMDPDWAPVEWRGTDGSFHGISSDYLHRLEAVLGVRFQIDDQSTWQEALRKGRAHELDLLACAAETGQRRETWTFTAPYVSFPIVIFAAQGTGYIQDLGGLTGRTVAVVHDYAEEELLRRDWPGIALLPVPSTQAGVQALHRGAATALVSCLPTTAHLLQASGDLEIHMVGETPYSYHQSMAVRKDWPELAAILDKGLATISADEREAIRDRWMDFSYRPGFPAWIVWRIALPLALVLAASLLWNHRLRREVDRRRAIEDALRANQDKLEQARSEALRLSHAANAANAAKSEFLASMSHEIRTPLNAVLGYAQLLTRDPVLGQQQRKAAETINRSGEHLLALINDILEMSRIEAGHSTCDAEDLDLPALLDNLKSLFQLLAQDKRLSLTVELDAGVPRFVRTDQRKLRQILFNLLSNALKFTISGGVVVTGAWRDGTLTIAVRDSGPGLTADDLAMLFRPFVQTRAGQRRGEGSGLGLALSRGFARILGGDLSAASTPGAGSTFTLAIPAAPAGAVGRRQPSRRQVTGLAPGQPAPSVLIAEDHAASRELLAQVLRAMGCEVRAVEDGAAAIAACAQRRPDLVWMDIDMPGTDGLAATRAIRAQAAPPPVIVALTAAAFDADRQRILASGCDEVMNKPYREEELFGTMERLLGIRFVWTEPAPERPAAEVHGPDLRAGLAALPAADRESLRAAVITGDIGAIAALAAAWADRDLAAGILALAEAYALDRLDALLADDSAPPPGGG
jgi:polar amino acid transport system substrate-binding protein